MNDALTPVASVPVPPPPSENPPASRPPEVPLPQATMKPVGRLALGWFWILPGVVLVIVILVVRWSLSQHGPRIVVHFKDGHGLKAGDDMRHRGVTVGKVYSVELLPDLKSVEVLIYLRPTAAGIAVENSHFWIIRPLADLTGVSGLETVVGAKAVAVSPGSGAKKDKFDGDEASVLEEEPGGLRIVVQDRRMGGLHPGAPLTYRGVRIGGVVSSKLASDASAVEVEVHVLPAYKALVRTNSKFWTVSGFKVQVGLRGVTLNAESAQTVLAGGMAMATEDKPGPTVSNYRRFSLDQEEPKGWQDWNPLIPLINPNLPDGTAVPQLVRAVQKYKTKGLFGTSPAQRRGLLLPVDGTWLLGPEDLLSVPKEAAPSSQVTLEFRGRSQPIPASKETGSLRWLKSTQPLGESLPRDRLRQPHELENCVLVTDSTADTPLDTPFVSKSQLKETETGWTISEAAMAGLARETWHGAAAVSVGDGKVIGLLLVPEKGPKRIIPLTEKDLFRH